PQPIAIGAMKTERGPRVARERPIKITQELGIAASAQNPKHLGDRKRRIHRRTACGDPALPGMPQRQRRVENFPGITGPTWLNLDPHVVTESLNDLGPQFVRRVGFKQVPHVWVVLAWAP